MEESIESLKKKVEYYEQKLGVAKHNPAYDGCIVLNNLLKQQNTYLKKITIEDLIVTEEKGKASEYERAKSLWESLPKNISALNSLKNELGMEFSDDGAGQEEVSYNPQTVGR